MFVLECHFGIGVIIESLTLEQLGLLVSADVWVSKQFSVVEHIDDMLAVNLVRHLLIFLFHVVQTVIKALHFYYGGVISGIQLFGWLCGCRIVSNGVHVHRSRRLAEALELLGPPVFRSICLSLWLHMFSRFLNVSG